MKDTRLVRRTLLAMLMLALVLAACGGGTDTAADKTTSPTASPGVTCEPSGTELTISADTLTFDKNCLAAPAGQPFTVKVNSTTATQHNFAIYTNENAAKSLFKGEFFTGPKVQTNNVPAQQAGTYFFRCDVHPGTMLGTFIVK